MKKLFLSVMGSTVLMTGCGGSDGLFGSYEVTDINARARQIERGESTRIEVFFNTKRERLDEPKDVEVVVFLPPSLEYVTGRSYLYDDSTDDSDIRDPDSVLDCEGAGTYVVYRLDDNELEDRELSGGDFGLRFDVRGLQKDPVAEIEASADDSQEYRCRSGFDGEKNEVIEVTE